MAPPYFELAPPIAIAPRGAAGESPGNTLPCREARPGDGATLLHSEARLARGGGAVRIHADEVGDPSHASGRGVAAHGAKP